MGLENGESETYNKIKGGVRVLLKHGDRPQGKKKRLYHIWLSMRERCNCKTHKQYMNYGGRGIDICPEWDDYSPFREWAYKNGYNEHLTLDRIDNNAGYSPQNCRWATRKEQANNRRSNRLLTLNGETHNTQKWCEITGLTRSALDRRLQKGWDIERALTQPLEIHRRRKA